MAEQPVEAQMFQCPHCTFEQESKGFEVRTIRILVGPKPGEKIKRIAFTSGALGVHQDHAGWAVTQLPTGFQIMHRNTCSDALVAAHFLVDESGVDWNFEKPEDAPKGCREAIKEAHAQANKETLEALRWAKHVTRWPKRLTEPATKREAKKAQP